MIIKRLFVKKNLIWEFPEWASEYFPSKRLHKHKAKTSKHAHSFLTVNIVINVQFCSKNIEVINI